MSPDFDGGLGVFVGGRADGRADLGDAGPDIVIAFGHRIAVEHAHARHPVAVVIGVNGLSRAAAAAARRFLREAARSRTGEAEMSI